MKYISVVIALALMIWTWSLATSQRAFGLEQHKQVEAGVEDDVRGFIQRKYPQTSEMYCPQLYTELGNDETELTAHFRCLSAGPDGTEGEVVDQVFEGFLKLKSGDHFQTWSEIGGEIKSPEINFRNGVRVSPENHK